MMWNKCLFIVYVILGSVMLCDAVVMFYNSDYYTAIKDLLFGIGFGSIGFMYLLSRKNK